jgi:WD40 repeat protein
MKDFQAPAACLYNKTSKDYVLAVGKALVVYEATTGFYARRIPLGRQISAAAFDVPRERRVVLGTENGEVLVVNYISGEVISKIRAHQGEIVGVAHGGDKARCVISAGRDNCLKVHQETSKGLELLRTVENAQSWVGSLAYSPVLSLIATGSRSGRVALWDFCTLQQMQNLQCRGAVASVLFLDPRPLLLTGDAHGSIIMWLVRPKKQVSTLCVIEGAGSGITSHSRRDR